jgi:hypothetical protein
MCDGHRLLSFCNRLSNRLLCLDDGFSHSSIAGAFPAIGSIAAVASVVAITTWIILARFEGYDGILWPGDCSSPSRSRHIVWLGKCRTERDKR